MPGGCSCWLMLAIHGAVTLALCCRCMPFVSTVRALGISWWSCDACSVLSLSDFSAYCASSGILLVPSLVRKLPVRCER